MIQSSMGGKLYLHGSSYGAIVAYRAFLYDPHLYDGVLLDGFMPRYDLFYRSDLPRAMADSCIRSPLCANKFPLKSPEQISQLISRITDESNKNACKTATSFIASHSHQDLKFYLDHSIRKIITEMPRFRGIILPFLYHVAECPVPEKFTAILDLWAKIRSSHNSEEITVGAHGSAPSEFNRDYGRYLRFSEMSTQPEYLQETCKRKGSIFADSFTDSCYVFADYIPGYEEYLYKPQIPPTSDKTIASSTTILIILSGKWDTQTPHELAEAEYHRLPLFNKYIFVADHGTHGLIDNVDSFQSLSRTQVLEFLFERDQAQMLALADVFVHANLNAEQVWLDTYYMEPFRSTGLWCFNAGGESGDQYEWPWFYMVVVATFALPILTLLGIFFRSIA